jgi:hypothetical protein
VVHAWREMYARWRAHGQYGAVSNLQDTFGAALCSMQLDKNGVWPGNTPEISSLDVRRIILNYN